MRACMRQPQWRIPLAPAYRAGNKALFCGDLVDWAGRSMTTTLSANLIQEKSSAGRGLLYNYNAANWFYPSLASEFSGANAVTYVFVARKVDSANGYTPINSWNQTYQIHCSVDQYGSIAFGVMGPEGTLIKKSANGAIQDYVTHTVVVSWRPGSLLCFVDGKEIALSTNVWVDGGTVTYLATSSRDIYIAGGADGTWSIVGMSLVGLWARDLPNQQQLSANPWQLFAEPQWLYTGMGSGSWTPLEVTG